MLSHATHAEPGLNLLFPNISPFQENASKQKTGNSCEAQSSLSADEDVELFFQISQEIIDLPVFTVCLQIEAGKLESNPRKHVA